MIKANKRLYTESHLQGIRYGEVTVQIYQYDGNDKIPAIYEAEVLDGQGNFLFDTGIFTSSWGAYQEAKDLLVD